MTEFIAKAKIFGTDNWKEGQIIGSNVIMCTCKKEPAIKQHSFWYIDAPAYYINPETVCWKCPETPYFEKDIIKVTDEFEEDVIGDVFFHDGAFLFALEEDRWITIPNLMEMGYKITLLGNTIDNPELIEDESNIS